MSFRDPSALLWLLLAAPLVALYLVRPRAREARVGSLFLYRFVSQRQAARAPLARLEKLLSLLLHLGALVGISLALAGPSFGPSKPRRIVAILDASASMGSKLDGATRFSKAVERARSLGGELREEDEIRFVLAGASPRLLFALDEARLEGGSTNLTDALALAAELKPTETWVFSDGAPSPAQRGRVGEGAQEGALFYARFGSPDDANVAIVALAARALPGSESTVEAQATLENASGRSLTVSPTFTLDGLPLVALASVEIGPWSTLNLAPRRLELPQGGVLGLHVATPGDVLDADDDALVVIPPQRRTRVSEPDLVFLRAALEADDSVALVAKDADVTLGERLVLGPDEVAAVASRLELKDLGLVTPPRVSKIVRDHAVLRHVGLDDVVFTKARHIEPPPGWEVLVAAGDVPLVLARERGRERTLVFTFAPEATDLVLKRAWPLLVSNAVQWLRGESLRESEPPVKAGAVARIPCEKPVTCVKRAGESLPFEQRAGVVTTTATERPGVYDVFAGDERVARFTVSLLDAEESKVGAKTTLGLGEKPAPAPRGTVAGIEWTAALPLLALALLLIEWWAHHRRELA